MPYTVRDYDNDAPNDPAMLAAMFNDFDSVWPGGFTRGVPETAERTRTERARQERLAVLIVEDGTEFAGFCDLKAESGDTEVAYIPLLGARPSHHGKGVGKMLLREMVRRVTEKGFRELTLHTWAGNLKAVPLYKKTGFNWVPETGVFMRNFIPSCLMHPVGKAFFANRDWYDVLDRKIEVAPDDVKWNGMKVFPYSFRDGDDFVNFTFDATSGGLTALETPDYRISCVVPVEEAPAGETVPITYEIAPRDGKTLEVLLMTETDPGLELRILERLTVDKATTITRDLKVNATARPVREGEKQRRVRTTLLIDGQPVSLETGVNVVLPVEIEYSGQGVFVGRENKITVTLASHLDRPVTGTLTLDGHPSLDCPQPSQSFFLSPRMKTQCEFSVTARESGAFPTSLHFEADGVSGKRPVVFRAMSGSAVISSTEPEIDESATIEIPGLSMETYARGGWLRFHSTALGEGLGGMLMPELGPPFVTWRNKPLLYPTRIEMRDGEPFLIQSAPSAEFPGLTLERIVSLISSTVARVQYRVVNTTGSPQKTQVQVRSFQHNSRYVVVPYADGVLREPQMDWDHFPSGDTDVLSPERQPAESWLAAESKTGVFGVVWHGSPEVELQWGLQFRYDVDEIPANGAVDLPPLYLVGGAGNWETVRSWWRQTVQPSGTHEEHKPETHRALDIAFSPSPALLTADTTETVLRVRSRRGKEQTGTLTISGDAFIVEPSTFTVEGVNYKKDGDFAVNVTGPKQPFAGLLTASLDITTSVQTFPVPAIRIGAGDRLSVEPTADGLFVVDNGVLTLRIAPEFAGSVVALETAGVNHLTSSYPTARPHVWSNPWFGGIHLHGWIGDDRLVREKFTGEPVARTGERGLVWQGVRVTCQPQHKDLRWVRVEAEYLTLPGSNVVALISRWTNQSRARQGLPHDGGMFVWAQPGGNGDNAVMHWSREKERRHRRPGGFPIHAGAAAWGAIENAETRDALLLVPGNQKLQISVENFGRESRYLMSSGSYTAEPYETKEVLTWLIVTRDLGQADAYASLSQVRTLP